MKYYTVYHDEEIVAFGSAVQCTMKLGLKNTRGFHALVSKSRSGLLKHYKVVVEELSEKENYFEDTRIKRVGKK